MAIKINSFIDLKAQQVPIRSKIDQAIQKVLDHGIYIMGPEVAELEEKLARFCGVNHVISCANGTDALGMVLFAKNVGPGDAVFVPSFTFAATAEVVAWVGATPIFIDSLPQTFNMDPESLSQGIALAKSLGLRPRGVIPVDLFGQPADYEAIQNIADTQGIWVMADAAQSCGARYKGRPVESVTEVATTSFFPAKPLGCYGDGGAIFTNDDDLALLLKSLRIHGQGADKYDNVRVGINGRLDTLQAAILLEKLRIFPEELEKRQRIAERYKEALGEVVTPPFVSKECISTWAQYTVLLPAKVNRSLVMNALEKKGIPTVVYYVKPLHLQTAYKKYPRASAGGLPVCEALSECVLSLPLHPYLSEEAQDYITQEVITAVTQQL